jgi:metal-responsive CopG/Arc/MetJ family transcriptional regulator
MVMEVVQVRLTKDQLRFIDDEVKLGFYSSRADYVRDIIRRNALNKYQGAAVMNPEFGGMSAIEAVKKFRKQMDKEWREGKIELNELNKKKLKPNL